MTAATRPPALSGRIIAIGLAAVVAVLAVIAIALTRGSSSPSGQEARPVAVAGEPLPKLDDAAHADAAIGVVAPTLSGQSFDGTPVQIGGGRPTLVVFLAHW